MNVSIIIPTHNRYEQTIRAIESVRLQSHNNWDLILVDDGSQEDDFIKYSSYCSQNIKNNFLVVRTPNLGVSHARNLGIKLSSSPWLSFLDSDDEWLPHKLETQVNYLLENPEIYWLHSEEKWVRNGIYQKRKKKHQKRGGYVFGDCINQCFIGPSTAIISRKIFKDIGLFNEIFPVCEDYELWLRISEKYPLGYISQELIVKNGGHCDQLSTQFKAMDYWRVKALVQFLSSSNSPYQKEIIAFIDTKTKILCKGFLKYGNGKRYKEMQGVRELIQLVNSNN